MSGRRFKIDPAKAALVESLKEEAPKPLRADMDREPESLDKILKRQMLGLERLTKYIVGDINAGAVTKDTASQLATCIKITMDLKAKENELLDELSEEDLAYISKNIE